MPQHKRNTPHHLHGIRVLLFGVLVSALFLVRVDSVGLSASRVDGTVLAYATNMNRTDLLNATNSYRAQNGLGALSLNSQLNTAAQNKAQHMIANDYWAHVAPDGTQPWYFFEQAGYNYSSAGENLAYGFDTSNATLDAWMNSASHRANVLGNYVDIGFGIASGPSYQGGENTVVVAHYGTPQMAAAAPVAPAQTQAKAQPPPQAPPSTPTQPVAAPPETPPAETPAPADSPQTLVDIEKKSENNIAPLPVAVGTTKNVSVFEGLQFGNVSPLAIASLSMTVVSAMGFAFTHRSLVRHAVASGEKFALHHPALDTAALAVIATLILTTTVSRIG